LIERHKQSAIHEYKEKSKYQLKKKRNASLELPKHYDSLKKSGADYLRGRGFDVKQLIENHSVAQGALGTEYEKRIICPITHNGELVSFVTRDLTGKKKNKYKKCPDKDELIPHKQVLVGKDEALYNKIIVVEGLFDRYKMPKGTCVCTLGVKYSVSQMRQLLDFDEIYVIFDGEIQAQKMGKQLCADLAMHGKKAYNLKLADGKDPGELSYSEAEEICIELGFDL